MHVTDYSDLPPTLLPERMVMSVIRRKQKHSADHRSPLPWPDLPSAPKHGPTQPPAFQLNDKTTSTSQKDANVRDAKE